MNFKKKIKLWVAMITILMVSSIFTAGAWAADADVDAVRAILKQDYVTELSDVQLRGNSVEEIIQRLNDPYTTLFTTQDFTDFSNSIDGRYQGIGIVLDEKAGYIEIVAVFEDSPAQRAGLRSKDILKTVDNTDLAQMPQAEVVQLLRGEPGTQVNLTVERGGEILQFTITRETISLPVVSSEMLADHIFYINISSFASNTAELVQRQLAQHPDTVGIILDLRNNYGGYLQTAVSLGQEFMDPGPLVWLQNRTGTAPISLTGSAEFRQPMVLLVNQGSASASEIIAGAFQDEQRAVLVGGTTFGKFCVQNMADVGGGQVLKYTTDYFLTPSQRLLNKIGVHPDIVADDQTALAVAERLMYDQQLRTDNYRYLLTIDLDDMTAYLNAKKRFAGQSMVKNDLLYLSLTDAASEMGLTVWWDPQTSEVMVQKDGPATPLSLDDSQAFIADGKTYVSIHKLAQIIGGYVDFRAPSNLALLQWN